MTAPEDRQTTDPFGSAGILHRLTTIEVRVEDLARNYAASMATMTDMQHRSERRIDNLEHENGRFDSMHAETVAAINKLTVAIEAIEHNNRALIDLLETYKKWTAVGSAVQTIGNALMWVVKVGGAVGIILTFLWIVAQNRAIPLTMDSVKPPYRQEGRQ